RVIHSLNHTFKTLTPPPARKFAPVTLLILRPSSRDGKRHESGRQRPPGLRRRFWGERMWSIPDGFGGSSGGKTEEKPLLFPVVRQVLAQSQDPRRRQLDGLATLDQRPHNVRGQIGQPNQRSEAAPSYPQPLDHRLDAVVWSRQQLVTDRESFGDRRDEACVDLSLSAILDDA